MPEQLRLPEPKDTQLELILAHFEAGGTLTKIQALARPFRTINLGDKVFKLKKRGYPVTKRWEETPEGKRYAVYYFEPKAA